MKLSEVATENDRESTVDFITKTWSKIHQEETVQLSAKIKQHTNSHRWKDYNGRKVSTVNATDVEYITVELIDNPEEINRIKREIENHKTRQHDRQEKETTKTEGTERETGIQNQTEAIPNKTRKKDSLNKPESPPRIHHQEQIHIPDAGLSSECMHSNNRTQTTRQVQGHPNSIFMAKTTREISIYQLGVHRSLEGPYPKRTIHTRKTRPT